MLAIAWRWFLGARSPSCLGIVLHADAHRRIVGEGDDRARGAGVLDHVGQGLLHEMVERLLVRPGQPRVWSQRPRARGGVAGSAAQLHLQPAALAHHGAMRLQRRDETVLLEHCVVQVDQHRAHLGGGAGGEVADQIERGAGLRGLRVPQLGGGLGGQLQADEGLGHRVVQVVREAVPFGPGGRARRVRDLLRAAPRPAISVDALVNTFAHRSHSPRSCRRGAARARTCPGRCDHSPL